MGIAEGMKDIVENIVDSHNGRTKALKDLVADTCKTIKGFAADRKQMSKEQAEKLANFVTDLTENVDGLIKEFKGNRKEMSEKQAKDLGAFIKELEDGVCSMLEDFKDSRKEMAEELRERLAKEVQNIKTHVKGLLDEADELISGYRSDMKGARAAWQGMSSALAKSKKGSAMAKVEVKEEEKTVDEVITKRPFENRRFEEKIVKKVTKKKKK